MHTIINFRLSLFLAVTTAVFSVIAPFPVARAADATPAISATDPKLPTIFRAGDFKCRPAYGVRIPYHWQTVPMGKEGTVWIDLVDKDGNTVATDMHDPQVKMSKWGGPLEYTRWLNLPEYLIRDQKTLDSGVPDGTYKLMLYVKMDGVNGHQPLTAGPGVVADKDNRYDIGTLTVDKIQPVPKLGPKTLDLTGYEMTFHDEFDTLSVSAKGPCGEGEGKTRWMAHTPYWGDFGDAHFVDPTPTFPFTVKNGILSIEVRKQADGQWQGGLLSSADPQGNGFSQSLGYFEMRARLPKGPGTWPAFWLLTATGLGDKKHEPPVGVEIDVLEQYGHSPNKLCTTTHLWPHDGRAKEVSWEHFTVPGMTDDFHTYGVMITEDRITYYYDGTELRHEPTYEPVKMPLYVLINNTLGPGCPLDKTPNPSIMLVDYVRVYAKKK